MTGDIFDRSSIGVVEDGDVDVIDQFLQITTQLFLWLRGRVRESELVTMIIQNEH
jgi:hypothetical protein